MKTLSISVRHDVASPHAASPIAFVHDLLSFAVATLGLLCFMGVALVGLCVDAYSVMVSGTQTADR